MREQDVTDQLVELIDKIDIDQIGARKKIEEEIKRYEMFTEGVLGKKAESIKKRELNIRNYAKYILREGKTEEKRGILEFLKTSLTVQGKKIFT